MGKETHIQWCDSSNNPQMGCEGCELVKGQDVPKCYAKTLVDRYKGLPGWPENFETPKIFMDRVPKMLSWSDLTGQCRPGKPWLDNMPRIVFLNDMGDTFSSGMPAYWFKEVVDQIAGSPHQFLVLTKWPHRFNEFNRRYPIADNIWPGTTITSQKTVFRGRMLTFGKIRWLSIEPLWGPIDLKDIIDRINWVIVGGESGLRPEPCRIEWIEDIIRQCRAAGVPVFIKQLGAVLAKEMKLTDRSGGDWMEWPEHLRIRMMPRLP
jgi:protein gp37